MDVVDIYRILSHEPENVVLACTSGDWNDNRKSFRGQGLISRNPVHICDELTHLLKPRLVVAGSSGKTPWETLDPAISGSDSINPYLSLLENRDHIYPPHNCLMLGIYSTNGNVMQFPGRARFFLTRAGFELHWPNGINPLSVP